MDADREICRQAGMNDHISKPIDPDAMFATVMKWIKPRRARTSEPPAQKVEAASSQNLLDLPEIDGVDIKDGLKRVGGSFRLYRDLLIKFAAKHGDAGLQISDALHIGDRSTAERIAHTVKGVAGNIGIKPVQFAAEKLEKAIRESDGGLPAVRAKGFELADRGLVQVSMNMTDYRKTSLVQAFEAIRVLAEKEHVVIVESEIIGLVPLDAVLPGATQYFKLARFHREQVLEARLWE